MEFFEQSLAVRLKTHLDKYLVADDDQVTVRQSLSGRGSRWVIEHVDSNSHVIRLKSCYGNYLTASDTPFLLGMKGKKVLLQNMSKEQQLEMEWQPLRDGFQVKLKSSAAGTYLRANGSWRNTVTHDTANSTNWILFDVEEVDISTFSDGLQDFSSIHSSPRSPILSSMLKRRSTTAGAGWVMDLFHNAKAVRLKNHHNKYLYADEDEESVSQDRHGASKNNRWTVEFVTDSIIRLKSCYNKYLTASNHPFLLGMTGRKVLQTLPPRLDSSLEWEPIREGSQVKLRTRYGQYLRANGGLPPWRNSVTHDVPHRTATQEWILWDVDVVDIVVQSPAPRPPPPLLHHSTDSYSFTSSTDSTSSQQQSSPAAATKVEEGRAIYYQVVSDDFGEMDDGAQGFCINYKGNDVGELTRKLEEETGLNNITVCTRSPLDGNLYPLRLQLPPNNVTMKVVVVPSSSSDCPE